jgi:hypothetical protein
VFTGVHVIPAKAGIQKYHVITIALGKKEVKPIFRLH